MGETWTPLKARSAQKVKALGAVCAAVGVAQSAFMALSIRAATLFGRGFKLWLIAKGKALRYPYACFGISTLEYKHTATVLKSIKDHLSSGKVNEIAAYPRVDVDGDEIVEIRVSVGSTIEELDKEELMMLAVHVRAAMINVGENSFPILRILTKKDWAELQR